MLSRPVPTARFSTNLSTVVAILDRNIGIYRKKALTKLTLYYEEKIVRFCGNRPVDLEVAEAV